jgi:small subunit ribosomal protein S6
LRDYELVLLVSPDVGDEGYPATVERVTKFIQDRGGEIKNVDQWGRRRLAYPITRFNEGFYAVTQFSLEPAELRALEGNLTLAEDVLRHLVVRYEEAPPPPPRRVPSSVREEAPPSPRRASQIGQDALVAAGQEPLASPEDSPLTPREEAAVAAGEEESVSPLGEAPVAAEAAPEPEWSPASEPDAPSEKEE